MKQEVFLLVVETMKSMKFRYIRDKGGERQVCDVIGWSGHASAATVVCCNASWHYGILAYLGTWGFFVLVNRRERGYLVLR